MYEDDSNIVRIANPIYDVVFKFLMADNKIAKLLLSTIIGHEIVELQFDPTETTTQVEGSITVLRMNFKATVRYDGSQQVVIIELQKAKTEDDIIEFYSKNSNLHENVEAITIIFMEDFLSFAKNIPVLKKTDKIIDFYTNVEVDVSNTFFGVIPKNSIILQMNFDINLRRTLLEKLLYLFNQRYNRSIEYLKIDRTLVSDKIRVIYWKLTEAFASPYLMRQVDIEDEVISILKNKHRTVRFYKTQSSSKFIN